MTSQSRTDKPTRNDPAKQPTRYAAWIGIDWADQKHAVCMLVGTDEVHHENLPHTPEDIAIWAGQIERRFQGQPVAIALEQSRGSLAHALMEYPQFVLFPINPKQASCYREALANSGKKDDPTDAKFLAIFLREHHQRLRPWQPDNEATRKLARYTELRRKTVESRKQTVARLTSTLKLYFPMALTIADTWSWKLMTRLVSRWPTLGELQRANPRTLAKVISEHSRRGEEPIRELIQRIRSAKPLTTDRAILEPNAMFVKMLLAEVKLFDEALSEFDEEIAKQFAAHPDAEIFRSPPGAGEALAPRLLAAFGSDRERFASAAEVQCPGGIAPVTKSSGKSRRVQKRHACNKFLRQTFHEFADQARKWSTWSKATYRYLRAGGHQHHAAVRSLAFQWIRILFRCWQNRQPYSEERYLQQLKRKNVPYLKHLDTP